MVTTFSLRKSLREIPALRSLSGQDLDTIVDRLIVKTYRPGDVLWRTTTNLDILGIIQSGEVIVEQRNNGTTQSYAELAAGDFVYPKIKNTAQQITTIARAKTDVKLYVLSAEQLAISRSEQSLPNAALITRQYNLPISWHHAWAIVITVLVLFLTWSDLTRIASGMLFVTSNQVQSTYSYHEAIQLLQYAQGLDKNAVFAHNQEGYLWFQHDSSQRAEIAFSKAVELDKTSGPALNNLAVTYTKIGSVRKALSIQERAAQNDPNNAIVQYNLGLILMQSDDHVGALRAFTEAGYITPMWVMPYLQQSNLYILEEDYGKAETAARAAIQLAPTQQPAHLILAIALYHQGKNIEALNSIESALKINSDNSVSKFYEALIVSSFGEVDTAIYMLEQIIQSTKDQQQIARIESEIEALRRLSQNPSSQIR